MYVGKSIERRDARDKVTGAAQYLDDLSPEGTLHGLTVRSEVAHGRIRAIRYDPDFDWSGIVRVDHSDIPGDNVVPLFKDDQPCLAASVIRHLHEPVVLLAGADPERVREAARHVLVDVDPLPAVFEMCEALQGKVHVNGDEHNVLDTIHMRNGDVQAAFAAAAHVVRGDYRTGYQEQLYIEPQGMLAIPTPEGGLCLHASCQCPYFIVRALARILRMPAEQLEVIQAVTGGAFGGKEEYPSIPAAHCALLARKAGAPVKLVYERHEDLVATTKRHPALLHLEHAVAADGTILAMRGTFDIDAGAYATLSKVVLSRGLIHLPGPYRVPAVDVLARVVATNTVPNGAFRGFGAPQATFAYESQLNRIASACGVDPLTVRRRNLLRPGDRTATGMLLDEASAAHECLDRVLAESCYEARRAELKATAGGPGPVRRGVGLSVFLHGAGFTGSGEARIKGRVAMTIEPGGRFRVRAATVEMGQGMRTTFPQIAADALGVEIERVFLGATSTAEVPDSGPTVASRTAMVVGRVVEQAALDMRRQLNAYGLQRGLGGLSLPALAERYFEELGQLRTESVYDLPPGIRWDDALHMGDAYPTYSWAAEVVEVEVDTDTGEVRVLDIVNATDVGRALHPQIVEGQIEGGTLQGVGLAYGEVGRQRDGHFLNDRLATYTIPTTEDTPRIRCHVLEKPFHHGPYGAKGVGEMPLDGVPPAITLAIEEALGVHLNEIPVTPEHLIDLITATPAPPEQGGDRGAC